MMNYLYIEIVLKPYFLFKILFGRYFGIAIIKCLLSGKYKTEYYKGLKSNILSSVHLLLADDYSEWRQKL
jgi:hypothetical protein